MKLTLNKACDLNSISVLPPHSRRGNAVQMGSESSIFAKASSSRLGNSNVPPAMSQSQQSFSQGMPLSQLSQNSMDELTLTNEQRLGSQEKENSAKRVSCLAPVACGREEAQLPLRSSVNMVRRWNPALACDSRCSEELERRLSMMDTTLHRLGMILDSIQGDVMQINKAVKELSLEVEGARQKIMSQDNALQLVLKEEEAIRASIDGTMKSIPDELRKQAHQPKLQEIATTLTSMPDLIEARFYRLKAELCCAFTREIEAIKERNEMPCTKLPLLPNEALVPAEKKTYVNATGPGKQQRLQKESGALNWSSAKAEGEKGLNPLKGMVTTSTKKVKNEEQPTPPSWENWRIIIDSDEEPDMEFPSCFMEKGTGRSNGEMFLASKGRELYTEDSNMINISLLD